MTDERGQALVGAIVQLRDNATLQIRSYITQSDGEYHFEQLSTDRTYKVQAIYKVTYGRSRAVSKFSSRAQVTIYLVIDLSLKRSSHQLSGPSKQDLESVVHGLTARTQRGILAEQRSIADIPGAANDSTSRAHPPG